MASNMISLISACSLLIIACSATPTSRIIGGFFAEPNQFPHQISLLNEGTHNCGGSILNTNIILTAAHCVLDDNGNLFPLSVHTVVAGTNSLVGDGVHRSVKKVISHPNYGNFINDVALLFLSEPLEFTESIQPIELDTEEVPIGSEVIISGWGRIYGGGPFSEKLKFNILYAVTQEECAKRTGTDYEGVICLGHAIDNGMCNGDSGGPAVYDNKLVGVANFMQIGCYSDIPDGYAKVSYFIDWIQNNIAEN